MKRFLALKVALLILGVSLAVAQQTKWVADAAHTTIGFAISHMVISEVTGKFDKFTIEVYSDKPDFSDARAIVTIDVNSINTGNAKRDAHLRSSDFFDAQKYPTIKFISKQMKKVGQNRYKLIGDLTIKGITKEVTLDVLFRGRVRDPWGNTRAGFRITGEIDRRDFDITWNKTLDAGGLVVGNTVKLQIELELIKQKS